MSTIIYAANDGYEECL